MLVSDIYRIYFIYTGEIHFKQNVLSKSFVNIFILALDSLPAYGAYAPALPANVSVSPSFGAGLVLFVDGVVADTVADSRLPTITLYDNNGNVVLVIAIEPSFSNLILNSPLNQVFI